jgi:tetratricopeptide (TPR) repeat protein
MAMVRKAYLSLALLLLCCWILALQLVPRFERLGAHHSTGGLALIFGEGRSLLANEFFAKADSYYLNGYYPSIFDSKAPTDLSNPEARRDAEKYGFLGPPRDWIDRFSRKFFPSRRTEVVGEDVREMLPWLKIASEMDPHRIELYLLGAHWLWKSLNKPDQALGFLRDGLKENPNQPELMLMMGRIYEGSLHDPERARNLWEHALKSWWTSQHGLPDPDRTLLANIAIRLASMAEKEGNLRDALVYLRVVARNTPLPEQIVEEIKYLEQFEPGQFPLNPFSLSPP